jgi:hypothetical protein
VIDVRVAHDHVADRVEPAGLAVDAGEDRLRAAQLGLRLRHLRAAVVERYPRALAEQVDVVDVIGERLDGDEEDGGAAGGVEAAHAGHAVRVAIRGAIARAVGDARQLLDARGLACAELGRQLGERAAHLGARRRGAGVDRELDGVAAPPELVPRLAGHPRTVMSGARAGKFERVFKVFATDGRASAAPPYTDRARAPRVNRARRPRCAPHYRSRSCSRSRPPRTRSIRSPATRAPSGCARPRWWW